MSYAHMQNLTPLNNSPAALANAPHSQASMGIAQLAQAAQGLTFSQQAAQQYNAYAQQGMTQALAAQQYNQARQQQYKHHMWVWNGIPMDVVDFAKHAYGDTPEATHFILKYKETA